MRLKIYTGKSVKIAMDAVREELGENAVIVNIDRNGKAGPVRITAACDDGDALKVLPAVNNIALEYEPAHLSEILKFHNLNADFGALLHKASLARSDSTMLSALGCGLDSLLKFKPLLGNVEDSLMLVGQPGQGKTVVAAKLAAMAKLAGRKARIITMDSAAAGAVAQLEVFCTPLDIELQTAPMFADVLYYLTQPYEGLTVVDTVGLNPYALSDVENVAKFRSHAKIEPVWVFAANSDPSDIKDTAEIFSSFGVRRLIATRCDTARRYTAVISALSSSKIALAALSASPYVADLLTAGNAHALAELMLDTVSIKFNLHPKIKVAS